MGWRRQKSFLKILLKAQTTPKDIIKEYNIDCDVTGDNNFVVAHHKNKFEQIKEQAEVYKSEFGIETKIYSKEEFNEIGHGGTEQYGAFSYKPGFAINPLKFVNGIAKYALSKKLKIFEHTKVDKIDKENGSYILKTKEGFIRSKK
jgi:glycine/D-amino acid oxidase-like deaminating enzyme